MEVKKFYRLKCLHGGHPQHRARHRRTVGRNNEVKTAWKKIMGQKEQIKLFEQKRVRSVWDEEKEEWFFSVIDVVEVLTDSTNPTDYLKKMRKRDPELGIYIGTNCPQVAYQARTRFAW